MLVQLHRVLARHKAACFVATLLVWACCALWATRMQTDSGSAAFFPDSDSHSRRLVQALGLAPATRLVLVDVAGSADSTGGAHGPEAVAQAAHDVAGRIAEDLATPLVQGLADVQPRQFMALAPWYCDEAMQASLEAALHKDTLAQLVAGGVASLYSLLVAGPGQQFFAADPLQLREHILKRLPATAGVPQPDPVLGLPVTQDKSGTWHALLMLRVRHSLHDVPAATALMAQIEGALTALPAGMAGITVGGPRHTAANATTIEADVARIVVWSLLGFALVYCLWVRALGALWLLLVPCVAVSCALGIMSLAFASLSGLALGFGASVLGLAEDYAVHTHFALRSGHNAETTLASLGVPLAQGLLVNCSGFVVLLLSGLPAVRQLAMFAMLSLVSGYVLAVLLLPLLPQAWRKGQGAGAERAHVLGVHVPAGWRVLPLVALLLVVSGGLLHWANIDVSPRSLGADMAAIQRDANHVRQLWGGNESVFYAVSGASADTDADAGKSLKSLAGRAPASVSDTVSDCNTDRAMDRARELEHALQTQEQTSKQPQPVASLTALWPSPAERQANLARWQDFATRHGATLTAMLQHEGQRHGLVPTAFAPFERLLREDVAPFGAGLLRDAGLGGLLDNFVPEPGQVLLFGEAGPVPPAMADWALAVSPAAVAQAVEGQFAVEKRLVSLAWLACVALLFVFFRNWRQTLLAAVPPLCSLACILACVVQGSGSLTLASLAALPLVLGLATDHGILVTHELAAGVSFGVNRAVLVSSLTTLLGMGLLALAEHPALRSMGQVIFWGLVLEVPVAVWLLPALCHRSCGTA